MEIRAIGDRRAALRSAISNGTKLLAGVDGRRASARRFRDLVSDLGAELGGLASLSTADVGLLRQAAAMTMSAESLQAAIVRGETVDADALVRLSSEARRVIMTLRRHARPAKQPISALADYLASHADEDAPADEGGDHAEGEGGDEADDDEAAP